MKLIPNVSYRDNAKATFTRSGETLTIQDTEHGEMVLDLSGDWVKLEWSEEEDSGLIRKAFKADGVPELTITAYQPDSLKLARTLGVLHLMEQVIDMADGDSVTFPDYFEQYAPEANNAE